jgi:hypothetical protein
MRALENGESSRGTHHSSRVEFDGAPARAESIRALRKAASRSDEGKLCDSPSLQDGWLEESNELKPSRHPRRGGFAVLEVGDRLRRHD